jgi:hypothetical protein
MLQFVPVALHFNSIKSVPAFANIQRWTYEMMNIASSFHCPYSFAITSERRHMAYLVVLMGTATLRVENCLTPSYTRQGGPMSVLVADTKSNLGDIGDAKTIDVARAMLRQMQADLYVIVIVHEVVGRVFEFLENLCLLRHVVDEDRTAFYTLRLVS